MKFLWVQHGHVTAPSDLTGSAHIPVYRCHGLTARVPRPSFHVLVTYYIQHCGKLGSGSRDYLAPMCRKLVFLHVTHKEPMAGRLTFCATNIEKEGYKVKQSHGVRMAATYCTNNWHFDHNYGLHGLI